MLFALVMMAEEDASCKRLLQFSVVSKRTMRTQRSLPAATNGNVLIPSTHTQTDGDASPAIARLVIKFYTPAMTCQPPVAQAADVISYVFSESNVIGVFHARRSSVRLI
jgi:hypothetical protein